ncbi:Acetyltransferase, GNAT family [Devosia sp. LC5]|uniref:GNAT family N-acetyltransferase n=1 Tax=Devosia sp. LC5 TaxID=1502724 RepID=UPI0004E2B840|nr:GNAT family N-acetyltransferase [Devosia sp. LC5]KFC66340.1 Acetyltransferase, GNAT family [Devosia sp. LC5]
MKLETERLLLREWRDTDREAFAAIVADSHVMRFYQATRSRAEADAWIDKMIAGLANGTAHFLAVERKSDGAMLGLTGTADINFPIPTEPKLEIGWVFGKDYWGQGYAPEAARAALEHAFTQLHASEVAAFTARVNLPSQRVMQKLGLVRDPRADFEHPRIAEGHPLRPHVLYRIANPKT